MAWLFSCHTNEAGILKSLTFRFNTRNVGNVNKFIFILPFLDLQAGKKKATNLSGFFNNPEFLNLELITQNIYTLFL